MIFHQGQLVRVASNQESTYQVLSIDDAADLCWVRRWPLSLKGSPAFSVSLHQLKQAEIKSGLAL